LVYGTQSIMPTKNLVLTWNVPKDDIHLVIRVEWRSL
jgi:hypothetical protein